MKFNSILRTPKFPHLLNEIVDISMECCLFSLDRFNAKCWSEPLRNLAMLDWVSLPLNTIIALAKF